MDIINYNSNLIAKNSDRLIKKMGIFNPQDGYSLGIFTNDYYGRLTYDALDHDFHIHPMIYYFHNL